MSPSVLPDSRSSRDAAGDAASHQLWTAAQAGDLQAREILVKENLSLVHSVAVKLSRNLSADTDFDELVSAGSMGLLKAIAEFDLTQGYAFSTYAVPKIRGAILDELRRLDHVPRSVRKKARDMAAARETLVHSLGRQPSDKELASHLGVDKLTLWRMQADVESAVHVPLERTSGDRGDATDGSIGEVLPANDGDTIDDLLTAEQRTTLLRRAIMALDEQPRTVLSLYYFEDLRLHEIGEVLGLTESRVSQIRAQAIDALRRALPARDAF